MFMLLSLAESLAENSGGFVVRGWWLPVPFMSSPGQHTSGVSEHNGGQCWVGGATFLAAFWDLGGYRADKITRYAATMERNPTNRNWGGINTSDTDIKQSTIQTGVRNKADKNGD